MSWLAGLAGAIDGGMKGYSWWKQIEGEEADRKAREEEAAFKRSLLTKQDERDDRRFGWEADDRDYLLTRRPIVDATSDAMQAGNLRRLGYTLDPATGKWGFDATLPARDTVAGQTVLDGYKDTRDARERERIAEAMRAAGANANEVAGFSGVGDLWSSVLNARNQSANLAINRDRLNLERGTTGGGGGRGGKGAGASFATAATIGVAMGDGTPQSAVEAAMRAASGMGVDISDPVTRNSITAAVLDNLNERAEKSTTTDIMGVRGAPQYPRLTPPTPSGQSAPPPAPATPRSSGFSLFDTPAFRGTSAPSRPAPRQMGPTATPADTGKPSPEDIVEAKNELKKLRDAGIPAEKLAADVRELYGEYADLILN